MVHLAVISPTFPSSKLLAFKVSLDHPSTSSNPISPTVGFLASERSMVVSTKKPGSHFKHLRNKKIAGFMAGVSGERGWKSGGKSGEKVLQDLWTNDPSWSPFDLDPEISMALLKSSKFASWAPSEIWAFVWKKSPQKKLWGFFVDGLLSNRRGLVAKEKEARHLHFSQIHIFKSSMVRRWHVLLDTPPKFNMEPENDGFQEELPFLGTSFQVPCEKVEGVHTQNNWRAGALNMFVAKRTIYPNHPGIHHLHVQKS